MDLDDSTSETIQRLLAAQTWAVVGLRDNPARAAYGVARFLQARGRRIVPVHQHPQDVFGEKAYATLADIPFPVDVVDVFVNSTRAGAIADQAVEIGAKGVWFQLDVIDDEAYTRVTAAGLDMVMDRCPAIEWPAFTENTVIMKDPGGSSRIDVPAVICPLDANHRPDPS
jgi:predicted CoA-binding protein